MKCTYCSEDIDINQMMKDGTFDKFNSEDVDGRGTTDKFWSIFINCHCPWCGEFYSVKRTYIIKQIEVFDNDFTVVDQFDINLTE